MKEEDVKRLALVLEVQAQIEAMKTANAQNPDKQPYSEEDFRKKAEELGGLAYAHDMQLFG